MILVDLSNNTIIYETPLSPMEPPAPGIWDPNITQYSESIIRIGGLSETILLELEGQEVKRYQIEGRLGREVGDDWAIINPPFGTYDDRRDLYNLETHQTQPLIVLGELVQNYYITEIRYLGDDQFTVRVGYDTFPLTDVPQPLYDFVTYTVQVTQSSP